MHVIILKKYVNHFGMKSITITGIQFDESLGIVAHHCDYVAMDLYARTVSTVHY